MIKTVGFVGLGNMGEPMARALAGAGFNVTAFDASEERRNTIPTTEGLTVTSTINDVAGCDATILMVPNGNIVHEILVGEDGLASKLSEGCLVIDMSSSDPVVYKTLEPALADRGVQLIDAPVSGNVSGAKAGSLTIMAGGATDAVEQASPLFDAMGKQTFHTGALGTAQTMKALNNLLSAGGLILACEILLIAKKAGLDPALVNSILNVSTGRNNSTERKIEPFVLSGRYDSGFGLPLMAKDLRTAAAIASLQETTMPMGRHVVDIASQAELALSDHADHTEVARWLELQIGQSLG